MLKSETTTVDRKRPPPVKVLSGQLRTAENRRTAENGDGCVLKLGKGRSLPVSLVWMQGTVMEVQVELSTVLLMDETGTFAVHGVNSIPKGKPCLSQGKHTSRTLRVDHVPEKDRQCWVREVKYWTHQDYMHSEFLPKETALMSFHQLFCNLNKSKNTFIKVCRVES